MLYSGWRLFDKWYGNNWSFTSKKKKNLDTDFIQFIYFTKFNLKWTIYLNVNHKL